MNKPNSYTLIILITIIIVIVIIISSLWPLILSDLGLVLTLINLVIVSGLAGILTILRIRQIFIKSYNQDKFEIERIGKYKISDKNYYFLTIRNKTNETAKNCRAYGVFGDEEAYNLIWDDPSYPKYIDIMVEEYLNLFYYDKDTHNFIIPESSINPLMFLKSPFDQINNKLDSLIVLLANGKEDIKSKENVVEEKITCWPFEANLKDKFNDYKDISFKVVISATNAQKYEITFKSISKIIESLQETDVIKFTNKEKFEDLLVH